jgi:hypothetical protein
MAETASRTDAGPMALTLTLSSQPAFLETIEALVVRLGEQAGCAPDASGRFGRAVRRALGLLIVRARASSPPRQLEVGFTANDRVARVELRFARGADPGEPTFDDLLTADAAGADLEKLVDRIEITHDDGRSCCRITQQVRTSR